MPPPAWGVASSSEAASDCSHTGADEVQPTTMLLLVDPACASLVAILILLLIARHLRLPHEPESMRHFLLASPLVGPVPPRIPGCDLVAANELPFRAWRHRQTFSLEILIGVVHLSYSCGVSVLMPERLRFVPRILAAVVVLGMGQRCVVHFCISDSVRSFLLSRAMQQGALLLSSTCMALHVLSETYLPALVTGRAAREEGYVDEEVMFWLGAVLGPVVSALIGIAAGAYAIALSRPLDQTFVRTFAIFWLSLLLPPLIAAPPLVAALVWGGSFAAFCLSWWGVYRLSASTARHHFWMSRLADSYFKCMTEAHAAATPTATCVLCDERPSAWMCLPCGHRCMCEQCCGVCQDKGW
jgi:hypothetical protein